ncbi:hypothetical protein GUF51_19620, partial [Xanthomonas citri pv. citri]|nr:hypothetical protein [Xanthomonas citri pv. citri]
DKTGYYFANKVKQSACFIPADTSPLERIDFDCSELQVCEFHCAEPNPWLIDFWSWSAGCGVEGFVHASTFIWINSVVLYTLL